jgi:hypothetical protein
MLRPAAAAVAAAVLAGGCATVPTVGRPEPVTGASGQVQQFVQPIAPAPRPGWSPKAIVQGFLAASASITNEHTAAAKQFLAPQLRRSFKPSWAVTVVGSLSPPVQGKAGPRNQDGASTETETVTLTGQQLATISNIGQYLDNPGPHRYTFRTSSRCTSPGTCTSGRQETPISCRSRCSPGRGTPMRTSLPTW